MRFCTLFLPATLACVLLSGAAYAGPCDAHFTFDGNLSDASGNGYDGRYIGKGGGAATEAPSYGEGRHGQALLLRGASAVRAPVDLSKAVCPQVTISAWVKFDDDPTKGLEYIFSSGRGGPNFDRAGVSLEARAGNQRELVKNGLRGGRWEFIAMAVDQELGKMRVYWRNRVFERDTKPVGTASADIWIGAIGDDLRLPVLAGAIDDVRVFGQLLTANEIQNFRPEENRGWWGGPWGVRSPRPGAEVPGQPGVYQAPVINHEEQYSAPGIGDGTDAVSLKPGQDLNDLFVSPTGDQVAADESGQTVMMGQTDSLPGSGNLDGSSDAPTSLMPGGSRGTDLSSNESLQQAVAEKAPLDLTYDSEEEGEAAAAAAEARRQQELAEAEAAVETTTRTQPLKGSGPYPVGEPRESSLAGSEGDIQRRIDLVDHFMHKVTWKQMGMSDRPCRIRIGGERESWDLADFACWASTSTLPPLPPSASYMKEDREVVLRGDNAAIGRLSSCRSALNQRLKGIRIWGEQINADGTSTYRDETDSEQFPNCADWSPSVLCPGNTLATGLVVHANDLGGDDRAEIVGLRLICRSIGVR